MKRVITVFTLMLIFLFSSWGTALSLTLLEREENEQGDDHGWGGENVIDPTTSEVSTTNNFSVYTSVTTVDLIVNETTLGQQFRNWLFRNVEGLSLQTPIDRKRTDTSTNVKRNTLLKGNR